MPKNFENGYGAEITPSYSHLENVNVYNSVDDIKNALERLRVMGLDEEVFKQFEESCLAKCQIAEDNPTQNKIVCAIVGTGIERVRLQAEIMLNDYSQQRRTAIKSIVEGVAI